MYELRRKPQKINLSRIFFNNDPDKTIKIVADWLRNASNRTTIPGGTVIAERYRIFKNKLPEICDVAGIMEDELGFNDYATFVSEWIKNNLRVCQSYLHCEQRLRDASFILLGSKNTESVP